MSAFLRLIPDLGIGIFTSGIRITNTHSFNNDLVQFVFSIEIVEYKSEIEDCSVECKNNIFNTKAFSKHLH